MPKLLDAHFALCRRHAKLAERRSKLRARPADERGPVRIDVALQRRLLDESGGNRGFSFKLDAHEYPVWANTNGEQIRPPGRSSLGARASRPHLCACESDACA